MRRCALLLLMAGSLFGVRPVAAAAAGPFDGWSFNGVRLSGNQAVLSPSTDPLLCSAEDVDGLQAGYDPASGVCRSTEVAFEAPRYNGGDFVFGTMTSPAIDPGRPIEHLIGSWDAVTPLGTWLELHVRVLQRSDWSDWYALPVWSSDAATLKRHSTHGRKDALVQADMDSLIMDPGQPASSYQLAVTLFSQSADVSPTVRLVRAAISPAGEQGTNDHSAWGTDLPVVQRSQMLAQYRGLGFGGGGEAWCSPTATSMIMAYWGNMLGLPQLVMPVATVAAGTYDYVYGGTGNWSFNTAFAGSYGLTAYVERFMSLDQLEPWIKASVPVAISISFRPGELAGAPISSTPGHLIVVRGFTARGDVIVNDPAAGTDAAVRMVYQRAQLERSWQGHGGTAYVMYPPDWAIPS